MAEQYRCNHRLPYGPWFNCLPEKGNQTAVSWTGCLHNMTLLCWQQTH